MNSKIWIGAAALVAMAATACNNNSGSTSAPASAASTPAAAASGAAPAGSEAAAAGTPAAAAGPKSPVTVTVNFTGTAPNMPKLKREADAFCAKKPMTDESVLVKAGKLENVYVHVTKGGEGTYAAATTPVTVEQQDCMYRPRVQGALAGSTIEIKSVDGTGHNVHTYKGDESLFNRAQNTPGSFTKPTTDFDGGEGLITFKCDIHPWMTGYLYIDKTPYFGVTGADGTVKLDLPAGKYTLETWQEKYGTKTQDITVEAGKPLDVKFDYSGTEKTGS